MNLEKLFKQKLLYDLYAPYKNCTRCPLGSLGRKNIVFGKGNPNANLMIIGEAPGREEDCQGNPFIGRAGKLLDKIFEILKLPRQDVFITNIVKCRPPNNRIPTFTEMEACKKLLLSKQIKIVQPRVICLLGSTASKSVLNKENIKITKIRGQQIEKNNIKFIPTLHPAYILRNPKELKKLIEDLDLSYKLSLNK